MAKGTKDGITYSEFKYRCGYCGAIIKRYLPINLKNCAVQCDCGNFLAKRDFV